jgi:hypothetical protein
VKRAEILLGYAADSIRAGGISCFPPFACPAPVFFVSYISSSWDARISTQAGA